MRSVVGDEIVRSRFRQGRFTIFGLGGRWLGGRSGSAKFVRLRLGKRHGMGRGRQQKRQQEDGAKGHDLRNVDGPWKFNASAVM